MLFKYNGKREANRNKHHDVFKSGKKNRPILQKNDSSIATEKFHIDNHFFWFIGTSAQNGKHQDNRSPDEENATRRSLHLIKYTYTFIIQSERKKNTESHDQQIDGQSDEEDSGKVIVEGIQGWKHLISSE